MFETTFPETGSKPAVEFASAQAGELRAFDWAELCARISATSELRRVVASARSSGGFASFAHSGPEVAETDEAGVNAPGPNYERAINLDASRKCKPCSAKPSGTSPINKIDRNDL